MGLMILAFFWLLTGLVVAYLIDLIEHDTVEVRDLAGYSRVKVAKYALRFHLRFWLGPIALVYYILKGLLWLILNAGVQRPFI